MRMTDSLERVKSLLAALPPADRRELRRYLADIAVSPAQAEGIHMASLQEARPGGGKVTYTFRKEFVRCGRKGCRCGKGALHGPYTYKYWREKGRLRKAYVGKGKSDARA